MKDKAETTVAKKVVNIVRYFAECLQEDGVVVDRVVVFGSSARGRIHKDSDIDLIVVSKSFRRKNIFKRAEMVGDAHAKTVKKFMVPMDILVKTPEEAEKSSLTGSGVVVFAA